MIEGTLYYQSALQFNEKQSQEDDGRRYWINRKSYATCRACRPLLSYRASPFWWGGRLRSHFSRSEGLRRVVQIECLLDTAFRCANSKEDEFHSIEFQAPLPGRLHPCSFLWKKIWSKDFNQTNLSLKFKRSVWEQIIDKSLSPQSRYEFCIQIFLCGGRGNGQIIMRLDVLFT